MISSQTSRVANLTKTKNIFCRLLVCLQNIGVSEFGFADFCFFFDKSVNDKLKFIMSDSEEEEEVLVLLEFEDSIPQSTEGTRIKIIGLDTDAPTVQYEKQVFRGKKFFYSILFSRSLVHYI